MRLCVLASGSSGNAIYLGDGHAGLLVDAGLSCRELTRRLGEIGVPVDSLRGVLVSHEHTDHVRGLGTLLKRHGLPVYGNRLTLDALRKRGLDLGGACVFSSGRRFEIDGIGVLPFSVPHDAVDPVGFVFRKGGVKVSVMCDAGRATHLVRESLRGSHVLVVEANHDPEMLLNHSRPWSLKQRIRSRRGHLSNEEAGRLVAETAEGNLRAVFLAHISRDCNLPRLAVEAVRAALSDRGLGHVAVELTYAERRSSLWEIEEGSGREAGACSASGRIGCP